MTISKELKRTGEFIMSKDQVSFSVVMPSYLGDYKTAAKNREEKIIRAVQSVMNQTHKSWELLIISDGCQKSIDIIMDNDFLYDDRVSLFRIERETLWGGSPRNAGIHRAKNDYVIYLDIDDEFMSMYLKNLSEEIIALDKYHDWYYVDDYIYTPRGYALREADIKKQGKCGTSNVIHKPNVGAYWPKKGTYAHDYNFINMLKAASKNYAKLETSGYIVQHIPSLYDR